MTSFLVKILANSLGYYLAHLPHWAFLAHIYALSFIFRILDFRRHKDARTNLDFAFRADLGEREKRAILKRIYSNFAFVLLETIRVPFIPKERHLARFSYRDERYLLEALAREKSAVLVSAHYGYWEALASALPPRYAQCEMASLGRLTSIGAVDKMIIARREDCGVAFIDKKGAFKHLLRLYSRGRALAGILVDQNISESEGVWVEFFGHRATHTSVASVLSKRFGVGIVPVVISINDNYKSFEVRYFPAIYCQKSADSERDILEATQAQADAIEQAIREKPEDWFWFHKRWKSAYGEMYK